MTGTLVRAFAAQLEVRASGDGRTIFGVAVPFDEPSEIREAAGAAYTEMFRLGAFRDAVAEPRPVKAFAAHSHGRLPIGRASVLREDPAGLYSELHVAKTRDGDEVLELVSDGTLDALSVGFAPIEDRWSNDRRSVERLAVNLGEISVVAFPAYRGAAIAGVRGTVSLDDGISWTPARRRERLLELL